jgi:hypothetical protein
MKKSKFTDAQTGNAHTPTRKGGDRLPCRPAAAQVSRSAPCAARQSRDDAYKQQGFRAQVSQQVRILEASTYRS